MIKVNLQRAISLIEDAAAVILDDDVLAYLDAESTIPDIHERIVEEIETLQS